MAVIRYGHDIRVVVGSFGSWNAIEIMFSWTWEPNAEVGIGSVLTLSLVLFSGHLVLRFCNYRYPVEL
jgi:hypothetical protein